MVDVHYAAVDSYQADKLYAALETCLLPVLTARGGAAGGGVHRAESENLP